MGQWPPTGHPPLAARGCTLPEGSWPPLSARHSASKGEFRQARVMPLSGARSATRWLARTASKPATPIAPLTTPYRWRFTDCGEDGPGLHAAPRPTSQHTIPPPARHRFTGSCKRSGSRSESRFCRARRSRRKEGAPSTRRSIMAVCRSGVGTALTINSYAVAQQKRRICPRKCAVRSIWRSRSPILH
jgi:hypothetical protein